MNVDLMFALPGQTLEMLGNDLRAVATIRADHLSIYHLTVEPNTWFAKHPPQLPSDDLAFEMQEHIGDFAQQNGFLGYEVSAFCSPRISLNIILITGSLVIILELVRARILKFLIQRA